jgi:acetoin utilization deacetylase AcuC-like enzyme
MLAVSTTLELDHHDSGAHHPERPERLRAAMAGIADAHVAEAILTVPPRPVERSELERVHAVDYLDRLERFCGGGGGRLDPDTRVGSGSWETARRAAGAGLAVIDSIDAGEADGGLVVVRPPGHHALADRAMGFCLFNNVAVAAASLAARGERVLIVDWDVHHGNGTQAIFWNDPRVLFVSSQLQGHWPFSGGTDETGGPLAPGTTINIPLPEGATGDVLLRAMDEVVAPAAEQLVPTWVLVSAGYDSHRLDPLGGLGFSAGDFADFTERVRGFSPDQRKVVLFLEGGYDLDAVRMSVGATVGALLGQEHRPERSTSGGPGASSVEEARRANLRATQRM